MAGNYIHEWYLNLSKFFFLLQMQDFINMLHLSNEYKQFYRTANVQVLGVGETLYMLSVV